MKYRNLIVPMISILLYACNGLGPIDQSKIQTENVEISRNDLVGKWKMDIHSYKALTGMEAEGDSIWLILNADSTFEINNSHLLFDGTIDHIPSKARWEITKNNKTQKVKLIFVENRIANSLDIYKIKKEGKYLLWYFLTDPDAGKRIAFTR